jgi:DinB superfamily
VSWTAQFQLLVFIRVNRDRHETDAFGSWLDTFATSLPYAKLCAMEKPQATEYSPAYQKYFDLVPEGEYMELLRWNGDATVQFFERIRSDKHDYRYAEGKWTIKEVFMHIIDTERVFAYRALAAARGDERLRCLGWMTSCMQEM